jgi:hypothetical protein
LPTLRAGATQVMAYVWRKGSSRTGEHALCGGEIVYGLDLAWSGAGLRGWSCQSEGQDCKLVASKLKVLAKQTKGWRVGVARTSVFHIILNVSDRLSNFERV